MGRHQLGILDDVPALARYLRFRLEPEVSPADSLRRLAQLSDGREVVVGVGPAVVARLGKSIVGLHEPLALAGTGVSTPSTPSALWCWLRGDDRGELVLRARGLVSAVEEAFALEEVTDGFRYQEGRDLSGYVDGTENPKGDEALAAAFVEGRGAGLDGGSFVAVQRWKHELKRLERLSDMERDHVVGRRLSDNEEIDDAPASAHVKRTAQESFDPEAFVLRRSMPWADPRGEGLVFVAFGSSFDAFEAQMRRMVGLEDGVVDALFQFTRPLTSSYFWCPPLVASGLDLRALGL